jgi:hypothetical protein
MTRQERRAAERKRLKDLRKSAKGADVHHQGTEQLASPSASASPLATVLPESLRNGTTPLDIPAGQPATTAAGISEARLAANRSNAQLSAGPVTPQGKAASSQNSFKHGLYSKQLIIRGENPAELDALKADLRSEHQPINTTEDILVNEMAEQYWRIKRGRRIEANLFSGEDLVIAHMTAVQRLMSSAERGFHKALKTLQELQRQRGFVPQPVAERLVPAAPALASTKNPSGAGFVPPKSQRAAAAQTGSVPSNSNNKDSDLRAKYAALEAEFESIERFFKTA